MIARDSYLSQPIEVSIETQTVCNAACTFCPYPTLDRKGARMSDRLVESLIEQMSHFEAPFYVSPFKVNEPLLDERLPHICGEIMDRCASATLRLFTNGQPLTSKALAWIARLPRVAHLWVSLNEYEAAPYQDLMSLALPITLRRLDALHADPTFPHPVVVSRVRDGTDRDMGFVEFVRTRWPRFRVQVIKRDGWLGYVEPTSPEIPTGPCGRWWELSIMSTGLVALCCMDGTGTHPLGDANVTSLLAIYNQPHLVARRTFPALRADITPCNRCTY